MTAPALVIYTPEQGISVVRGEIGSSDWELVGESISRQYLFNSGTASFIDQDNYFSLDGIKAIAEAAYMRMMAV
jgi:hypothetical protein